MTAPVGRCCIVLHTHLPWLAHAGVWPVGEEWLYQAWAGAYLPVFDLLRTLAEEGRRDLLTVGLTPVLAAQLDDDYCLGNFHTWLGFWRTRAEDLADRRDADLRRTAAYEFRSATWALGEFESRWCRGATPVLRPLVDDGVVELLGGPAAHPFLPLADERFAEFQLGVGLDDADLRLGARPQGIWAPECGYRPGLEQLYARHGVRRFLVDGPTLVASSSHRPHTHDNAAVADAWTVGDSGVVVFARDLDVTYRVWSPRRGYPGGAWYRDFHTWDHASGLHPARVTSPATPPEDKAPYDPEAGRAAARRDAADFVSVVRRRLLELAAARDGRTATVVAAYDTELFGHWWHEGPVFLEAVLRALPEAGVELTTLQGAVERGAVAGRVDLEPGSWGSGKDFRVWDNDTVADLRTESTRVQRELAELLATQAADPRQRDPVADQLAREALLAASSDWTFMVSKGSAPDYARRRAAEHTGRFDHLARLLRRDRGSAARAARELEAIDRPFGQLDARTFPGR